MIIKILLTIVFFAVMIGVGVYSRKQASSVDGFVLGGRAVGPWLTAFAYGTSYFSAVVFVGYAGQFGWRYGLSSAWIGIGNAIIGSLLAWLILGRRTKLMTQHIESRTMPDFFGTRFNDQGLRVVASVIAFVFLIPYTAGVYSGISRLFEMGFDIPYEYCVIIMSILTAIYVIIGGYKATAMNDFIQGIIMLFGITAVILAVLNAQGGLTAAVEKLAQIPSDADPSVNGGFASWFGPDPWGLLGVVILTSLGTMGLPQMVGKFYSITDESAIKRGTVISTIFAFIVAGGCYFLGGFGRLYEPVIGANGKIAFDSIVPAMLVTLPDVLIALVVLLVLSASMSTLASLVLTSSGRRNHRRYRSREDRASQGGSDASAHHVLHRHLAAHRPESPNVHRPVDGHLVGCFGRSLPRSLHAGTLLAWCDHSQRMGMLHLGCRSDCHQHVAGQSHQPHQLWRHSHGRWFPCSMAGQPLHQEDEPKHHRQHFPVLQMKLKVKSEE